MKDKLLGFAVGCFVGFVGCMMAGLAICEYAEGFGQETDEDEEEETSEPGTFHMEVEEEDFID